jgi:hypothetical protein
VQSDSPDEAAGFSHDVRVDEFKGLLAGTRSDTLELRLVEAPLRGFRTVERFLLDGQPCMVSRFPEDDESTKGSS